jgi:tetratricopeptide (TPR) repeat protein
MTAMADKLDDAQLLRLSSFLSDGFAFDTALKAAQLASVSAETVFMQGYCLYRLRRPDEAVELLMLAKHAGCDRLAIDAILSSIDAASEKSSNKADNLTEAQLKAQIEQRIEAGDFDGAGGDMLTYMRVSEPDSDIFATYAAILYYRGEYKRAAVAAECGLLNDGSNFDLLYNAGCIYEKLHDFEKSKEMLLRAVENCDDQDTTNEIMNTLGAIKNSGI